ncbi:hypothetical protein BCR44DRAFT_1422669 [Catenaria anguillulae PL171]|uniref:Secreted protein n=1 Tax=Catenaria anguillulae PL171 TaxID=765915 RepID=A0A1Y2I5P5_9FUNG|nr:hypothetical protein BCR44DRAFT_1422669 [Catenaria anguillulae PL171]
MGWACSVLVLVLECWEDGRMRWGCCCLEGQSGGRVTAQTRCGSNGSNGGNGSNCSRGAMALEIEIDTSVSSKSKSGRGRS